MYSVYYYSPGPYIQFIFLNGYFPDTLKIAKIQPIFKNGNEQDMKNYRPISILSVFSKTLEKLMFNRLNSFVEKYKILTDVQHGFREGRLTAACQSVTESTLEVLDNHLNAIGIFLDLSKAYDVLNHQILLDKLEIYRVRGVLKSWIKSYSANHIQFVEIAKICNNNTLYRYSALYRDTNYGVPRGSILGPILFWLYVNDLPGYVQNATLVHYADDTNILVVDKDIKVPELKTALVMKQLEAWLFDNELVSNTATTCAMLFHSSQKKCVDKPNIMYNNTVIAYSPNIKFLGITLTENLKQHAHIAILYKSLNKAYFMIIS